MRTRLLLSLVLLVSGVTTLSAQEDTMIGAIEDVEMVEWLTGPDSANQTDENYNVHGTDLGSMFMLGDRLYIAFGDTFACCPSVNGGAGGTRWRNNVIAYTSDLDPSDGITFDGMIAGPNGDARAVLERSRDDVTIIPTYGVGIGDRLYLHYMAVKEWGAPGHWTLNRSGWGYSDDGGDTWEQPDDATWEGDTNFGQAALVVDGDWLYVYGIHGGRYGGVALARVPTDAVLDMDAYEYWDGSDWAETLDAAVEIVPAPVGELSVVWNDYLGRWIMTYLDEPQHGIVIRDAPALTGPWSETQLVVSSDDYPSLYGSYLHPLASSGETIYFNMSQWGPYNVLLMRARLVRADAVEATAEAGS